MIKGQILLVVKGAIIDSSVPLFSAMDIIYKINNEIVIFSY